MSCLAQNCASENPKIFTFEYFDWFELSHLVKWNARSLGIHACQIENRIATAHHSKYLRNLIKEFHIFNRNFPKKKNYKTNLTSYQITLQKMWLISSWVGRTQRKSNLHFLMIFEMINKLNAQRTSVSVLSDFV